jgi:hypothetical protein
VRVNITLYAKVLSACRTGVTSALTNPFYLGEGWDGGRDGLGLLFCFPFWYGREGVLARKAGDRLDGFCPGYFDPGKKGEEVVVGAGEVSAEDEGQAAHGTFRWEAADFGVAAGAGVAFAGWAVVAGAEADVVG